MKLRFSITAKLIVGISVIIVAILINSYLINKSLKRSREINQKVSELYVPSAAELNNLHNMIDQSKALMKSWVFIDKKEDTPDKEYLRLIHNKDFPELHEKINDLAQGWNK
ncbi:MAG: methyl-accepting chemotaxis protein, partial [Bacteroidota bacterium]